MTGNETRLGPDDLVGREFAIGLRGYDRDEVDAFLAQAADAWRTSMAAAPPASGLSSSAMAALAESKPETGSDGDADQDGPVDPFAAPVPMDAFAPPAPEQAETSEPDAPAEAEAPVEAVAEMAPPAAPVDTTPPAAPQEPATAPAAQPVIEGTRAEAERDRTAAYAERKAAELDRAQARTELARAQEEALQVVDQAQRRAEAVLTGARDRAGAEAESVLEDARSRLTPLLEQERVIRARLTRLRNELDALTDGDGDTASPELPDSADLVTSVEDDPETPDAGFPVGYGSVSVNG